MSSKGNGDSPKAKPSTVGEKGVCFIIMPISDPEGYKPEHFQHVFQDLLVPACEKAGYQALRADQVRETNLIHLDVLQRIIDSPMVLCDLSSRNPNVLFELGLRQAFDKPVALVQEIGTPQIFDITPLRFANYRRDLIYHETLEDQDGIAELLSATRAATGDPNSVNSIVKLLGLTQPASRTTITEADRESAVLQVIMTELANLRSEIRSLGSPSGMGAQRGTLDYPREFAALMDEYNRIRRAVGDLAPGEVLSTGLADEFDRFDSRLNRVLALWKGVAHEGVYIDVELLLQRLRRLRYRHEHSVKSIGAEAEI